MLPVTVIILKLHRFQTECCFNRNASKSSIPPSSFKKNKE